jgi:uncharacterized membrane protein YphA (DoxX/SURF4 family)
MPASGQTAELVRPRLPSLSADRVALICGLIFVVAGLVKFVFYHWESHAFRDFGVPLAGVIEPLVGVLETIGGALLASRVLIVPSAFVLAVIMFVAFLAGGIIQGSPIPSDTLAPALLMAMIYLIRVGQIASSSAPTRNAPPRSLNTPGSWRPTVIR